PYIFTFRHPSEGGKSDVNTENQLDIIHNLIKSRPHFIDIELNKDSKYFREIIPIAMEFQVNLIFSYHEFYQTPPTEELKKVVDKFEKTVIKELEQDNQDWMYIYKVIPTAHTFTDNIIPLELCKMLSQEDKNIVSFCMGETGIFSRVLSPKAGSFFTYASIGEKTAPGQVHIDVVRKLWDIIE
ncbi:MAG: type I 3-dehydroquinate dehydratase, partial [Promethearchaeia archaeon]